MANEKKGFLSSIFDALITHSIVEAARDPETNKVDPYVAAGIALGSGKLDSFDDQMRLAAHLSAAGAFDDPASTSESSDEWRLGCEDGSEYGIDPFEYDSEEDYTEALEAAKVAWRETCEDGQEYGINPEDYDTKDEYSEAIRIARYAWRENCEDGSEFGIDPDSFETEDEYMDALNEAKYEWREHCQDASDLLIYPEDFETEEEYDEAVEEAHQIDNNAQPVSSPVVFTLKLQLRGQEALDAIKKSDYPNKRSYDAAYFLCEIEQGTAFISHDSSKEAEKEKCEFILSRSCIAAQYLTVNNGFLYVQAVKEHFSLPIELPDEDEEPVTCFDEMLLELAEYDVNLAVEIWRWCLKEFGPYQRYMGSDDDLYCILYSTNDYPESFMDIAVKALAEDECFRVELLQNNPSFPHGADSFVSYALLHGQVDEAKALFEISLRNPHARVKDRDEFIECVISNCSNWDELESMEAFKFHLLPVIHELNDRRIQRLLPKIEKTVNEYIEEVEKTSEKYQYSRCNAWRNTCVDGSKYRVNPIDYDTETEYLAAIEEEKYGWRSWYTDEAKEYGLILTNYETEEAFLAAVDHAQEIADAKDEQEDDDLSDSITISNSEEDAFAEAEDAILDALQSVAPETYDNPSLVDRPRPHPLSTNPRGVSSHWTDPQAEADKTVYTFCGVFFPHGQTVYHYLTDDESIAIGDLVVVPVGDNDREVVCEVATVEKHRRKTAPYPVDKAKRIICKYREDDSE